MCVHACAVSIYAEYLNILVSRVSFPLHVYIGTGAGDALYCDSQFTSGQRKDSQDTCKARVAIIENGQPGAL